MMTLTRVCSDRMQHVKGSDVPQECAIDPAQLANRTGTQLNLHDSSYAHHILPRELKLSMAAILQQLSGRSCQE